MPSKKQLPRFLLLQCPDAVDAAILSRSPNMTKHFPTRLKGGHRKSSHQVMHTVLLFRLLFVCMHSSNAS